MLIATRRRYFTIALFAVLFPSLVRAEPVPTIEVTTDRPDALYRAGDAATFRILLKAADGKPLAGQTMMFRITKDGAAKVAEGRVESATEPVEVTGSMSEPGFLRCEVKYAPPGGSATFGGAGGTGGTRGVGGVGGAGFEPEKISPSMPPPDDFHAFWQRQKDLLNAAPAKPVLTPVNSKDDAIEAFDLQINCPGGAPVSGYLARPRGAKPGSLPAILYPHSAGVRSSSLPTAVRAAGRGLLALDFNAHGLPNGKSAAFYRQMADAELKSYPGRGARDRETTYFRGMILRLLRALDFLGAQPEWDGRTLIVYGSSQGGGQALVAAGLDPRVTLCLANVPALCDHTGFAVDRASGWPRLVPHVNGRYDDRAMQAARYFDAMNFAADIRCRTIVTVGFVDLTCPPTSVYAAYNAIAAREKRIITRPGMGHAFPRDLVEAFDEEVRRHVERDQDPHR